MEEKIIYRVKDASGRFIQKDVKPIKVCTVIPPSDHKKLTALVPEGGTISDVLRDAIALYLNSKES